MISLKKASIKAGSVSFSCSSKFTPQCSEMAYFFCFEMGSFFKIDPILSLLKGQNKRYER
jgi:hypothetical protein